MTRLREEKGAKNGELSDAEKLEIAIKREKLRKARKAVNASLDGSFGKLKKRKVVSTKKHTQSFVLRQASALELKNRAIAVELAKTRQYCTQLERVNYCLKEKHLSYAMKLTSLENKLQKTLKVNKELERMASVKDELLTNLQSQLSAILRGIAKVQTQCAKDDDADHVEPYKPQRIAHQSLDDLSSDEEESLLEDEKESCASVKKQTKIPKKLGHDMSVLPENESYLEEEESSEDDGGISESDEEAGDVLEDSKESLEHGDVSVHSEDINEFEKSNADLRLQVSFSSVASSSCCHSDDDNKTSHTMVSMELTSTSHGGGEGVSEIDPDNESASYGENTTPNTAKLKDSCESESLEPSNVDKDTRTEPSKENNLTSEPKRQLPHKGKPFKISKVKKLQNRALRDHNGENAIFDFLSASSDSFVCDPNKKVKLNASRSFSPVSQKYDSGPHRTSDPGAIENEDLSTRRSSRRRAGPTSYAEPSLHVKLRRGDKISDGSLQSSFSPKKKKLAGKKKA